MAESNYFKDRFFMLKWVYIETIAGGETIPKNGLSKLYSHLEHTNIWLNDFLDCYLCEDDCIMCSILLQEGFKLWVKCVHDPEPRFDKPDILFQPCFLCVKCPKEDDVKYLRDFLITSPYNFITLDLYPWPQDAYYEHPVGVWNRDSQIW